MDFHRKSFIYGITVASVTYAVLKWYCGRRTRKNIPTEQAISSNKSPLDYAFLFNPTRTCTPNCSLNYGCYKLFCPICNYRYYLALIEGTRFSLDICVYLITSKEIAQIIFQLFKRGVYIRIVMDKEMMSQSYNSKLNFFMKNHIPIKLIEGKDGQIMHNKFVIIDREKLITGSLNWTESAFKRNFENALLIHNKHILVIYRLYFEYIWNPEVMSLLGSDNVL